MIWFEEDDRQADDEPVPAACFSVEPGLPFGADELRALALDSTFSEPILRRALLEAADKLDWTTGRLAAYRESESTLADENAELRRELGELRLGAKMAEQDYSELAADKNRILGELDAMRLELKEAGERFARAINAERAELVETRNELAEVIEQRDQARAGQRFVAELGQRKAGAIQCECKECQARRAQRGES